MEWLQPTETLLSPDVLTDGTWVRYGYVWRWRESKAATIETRLRDLAAKGGAR